MRVCNVQVFGEKGKVNDLLVSISVSYFQRNLKRKRLFSLITKSSLVSFKSSLKRVGSLRKGIYDALGNVWLIKINVTKNNLAFSFSRPKSLFYVIKERLKSLLGKMDLTYSNVSWFIGVNHADEILISFYEKEPTFYSIRKKKYEYRKGKMALDVILDFKEKVTKSLRRLWEVEELLS